MTESSKPSIGDVLKPFAELYNSFTNDEKLHDTLTIIYSSIVGGKLISLTVQHFRDAAEM